MGEIIIVEVNCNTGLTLPVIRKDAEGADFINMEYVKPHEQATICVDPSIEKMFEDGLLLEIEEEEEGE